MARVYYVQKGIAGFSAVLAIIVLVVCTWIFSSVLYEEETINGTNEDTTVNNDNPENADLHYEAEAKEKEPEIDIRLGASILDYPTIPTEPTTRKPEKFLISPEKNITGKNDARSDNLATFDKISKSFKRIIIGCAWASNFGALLQFCSCFLILCSSTLKMPHRTKYFVAIHFLVFIILIGTFFIPGAYNREKDEYYSMTGFNMKVKQSIGGFSRNIRHFLYYDLNAYYTFLAVDISFLFIIMVTICCLMKYEMGLYDSV